MSQFFKAEQYGGHPIEIDGFAPDGGVIHLNPSTTLELREDGTVVIHLPTAWVKTGEDEHGYSEWGSNDTAPYSPVTFSDAVAYEHEDGSTSLIYMGGNDAELRYIAQESPLGQALLATGLARVEPA
jgi:hypothetical protein